METPQNPHSPFITGDQATPRSITSTATSAEPQSEITPDDKTFALLIHLSVFFLGIFGPLLLWLIKKDESAYLDQIGKTALNFNLSYTIHIFIASLSIALLIGFILLPIILVMYFVFVIMAAIKTYNGSDFKPPLTITFLK